MQFRKQAISLVLLILCLAVLSFGQGIVTGEITGTVLDPQGAVVPNAKVTAIQVSTNITQNTVSNASGVFSLRGLPVGAYKLTISASGFVNLELNNVVVTTGTTANLGNQQLAVSGAETVVNVEAAAPLIESTTSQVTNTFATQQITDLPIVGGNGFDSLALLAPGVVNTHSNTFSNSNGVGLSVNGQRGRANNFEIDGQNNNDNSVGGPAFFFGNQDALQEVQVITNNFGAEYGRNAGSVVNYVTKSGTNSFHGAAYEFYNGSFVRSLQNDQKSGLLGFCTAGQTPAANGCTAPQVPRDVDNRYGGAIGGPIVKDKLWFFGSTNYEQNFQGVAPASSGTSLTPTPNGLAQLAAAFPNNPQVAALTTIGPFGIKSGNPTVVPGSTKTLTINGVPIEFGAVQRLVPAENNDKEITGRVDWQFRDKDHVFGRYLYQSTIQSGTNTSTNSTIARGGFDNVTGRNQEVGIDWTRSWTNSFVNQFRISYFRENLGFEGGAIANCLRTSLFDCPTSITIGKTSGSPIFGAGYATNIPQGRLVNNTQFQDNATWQKGNHSLKFGGEYDRQRSPNTFLPNANGGFSYSNFNNFINGVGTLTLGNGPLAFNFKEQDAAAYFEDDWKIFPTLTLNLGLRWDYYQQALNLLHDLTVARESNPATAFWNTSLPLSARTFPSIPENYKNFQPNFGFAWSPHLSMLGGHTTVIRGGYRINFDPAYYNIFLNSATASPVINLGSISCTAAVNCLGQGALGFQVRAQNLPLLPLGANPNSRNQTTVASPFKNPYAQNYTLGIQESVTSNIVAEIRYVGNHTIHNFQTLDANPLVSNIGRPGPPLLADSYPQFIPSGVSVCTTAGSPGIGRINCNNTNIRERANTAFSNYNALQTRLDFRSYHGMTAGVSYTWAHTIDNVSEIFSTGAAGNTVAGSPNPFNPAGTEVGNSGLDFPNVASIYMNYQLPFFRSSNGWRGKVLGGWELNNVWTYNSGQPASVAQLNSEGSPCDTSFNIAFFNPYDTCRPYYQGGDPYNPASYAINAGKASVDNAGNPVAQAAFNPFGSRRNTVRGETFNNLDTSIFKNTKITERFTLQLQATVFNILNRQYRSTFDPLIEDAAFLPSGAVDTQNNGFLNSNFSASNNRNMTLGAKIIF